MKFTIRTGLLVVLLFAVALVAYKAFFAPPILTIGMPKDEAIAALRRANADDILRLSHSSTAVFIPAGSKIKINKPSAKDIVEYQRFASVLETKVYSEETYWLLPTVGRFETHFEDGKLKSIIRWDGKKSETTKRLTLE